MPRVAIIGTGLIGASIGLRLRAASDLPDLEVVGADRESGRAKRAQKIGALDTTARDAPAAVRDASLVILSTPVLALRRVMAEIAPALQEGAIVTDTGSTKGDVMAWAEQELPRTVYFVGGHPMAGRTESGPDFADAALFEGARWAIVPSATASEGALKTVRSLVETVGAKEMFMDAAEHDAYVAAISHLPLMAASAMFNIVRGSEAWPELSLLAASGFKGATRLAGTEPNVAFDIAVTNRTQIVHWLERYREALRELQERIADEEQEEELFRLLAEASWEYTNFIEGAVGRTEVDEKGSDFRGMDFSTMLMGEAMASKMRDLTQRSEERLQELERQQRLTRNE